MSRLIFLFLALWLPSLWAAIDADISFIVADLKYNHEQGVKICELQTGCESNILGPDKTTGIRGYFGALLASELQKKIDNLWFVELDIINKATKDELIKVGGKGVRKLDRLLKNLKFRRLSQIKPSDPTHTKAYQCLVLANPKKVAYQEHPGALFLGRAFAPVINNKHRMTKALDTIPEARDLRPDWGLYPKQATRELTDQILEDIPADYLVLKTMDQNLGKGLRIIPRDGLETTLNELFGPNKKVDKFWKVDKSPLFLVEAFVPSDPILAPEHEEGLFDATMRVTLLFSYSDKKADLKVLEGHWKLPSKNLGSKSSMIEKHQSAAGNMRYCKVDRGVLEQVKKELVLGLLPFYESLLQETSPE